MRRNWTSIKGPGSSRAFQKAADEQDQELTHRDVMEMITERIRQKRPPVCDRSGDAGSTHIWAEGATVGDLCLCGKRKRFTPFQE